MRPITYQIRIKQAKGVVENLKENVMEIFWDEDPFEYCSSRALLPLIQEEAEYSIKKLKLDIEDQEYYIQKIEMVLGEYCEV